jgi:hypothetical protein
MPPLILSIVKNLKHYIMLEEIMVILGQLFDFFGFLGENFPQNRVY